MCSRTVLKNERCIPNVFGKQPLLEDLLVSAVCALTSTLLEVLLRGRVDVLHLFDDSVQTLAMFGQDVLTEERGGYTEVDGGAIVESQGRASLMAHASL